MPRFFVDKDKIGEDCIEISGQDAFHIARSLRMAVGDGITVCDGEGNEYIAVLSKIRDEACLADIIEKKISETELPVSVTLYMAYPKGDKLETVIQKAVELGADRIVPFESSRCIKRPKAEKTDKLLQRLNRIAEEAAKQCGRSKLARVEAPVSYKEMLSLAKEENLTLFCYEDEKQISIKNALDKVKEGDKIGIIVGSEGGFSPEEAALATDGGAISVSLGKRILRCETAPLFAISCIAYKFEL